MGLFDDLKKKASEAGKKIAESGKGFSDSMKQYSDSSKEAKAPVEGAIIRYGVVYLGGLAQYPKKHSGEIGFNIMPDSFYLKPTITTKEWFEDMVIPYDKIIKFEITTRQMTMAEQMMTNDARTLEQDNNIEITYTDDNNTEVLLRLEMLTGISVAGQAVKCREMMDILRQQGILKKLNEEQAGNTAPIGGQSIPEQIAKLNELKEAGILTEEEFNSKKSELLAKM